MPDRNRQLDQAERDFTAAVAGALTATADEFADALADATELIAARFSLGSIARMWQARVSGLVRRLLGICETAAHAATDDAGTQLPDGWDDLPGRYDDGRALPGGIGQYVETTEHLLRAVGDRLADATRRELAAGLDAGEDNDQLRDRLLAAFNREGTQLGSGREVRVARTEAGRAWNTATLAAAHDASGPDRPLVKQWITRHDTHVRHAHDDADGQIRLLSEPFTVGGVAMDTPHDPAAPARLVVNCRCRLGIAPQPKIAALESQVSSPVRAPKPRENTVEAAPAVTAAAGAHAGAMIALVPSQADAERLALAHPGAEPAHELHLTLFYLGEAADWSPERRADLIAQLCGHAPYLGDGPIHGRAFGANQWNADGDDPCWVWAVGDDRDAPDDAPLLDHARNVTIDALASMHRQPELPVQHSPWQPHVCAAYSRSPALLTAMNQRLGPIRFDRIRVAFAGEHTDIPLGPEEEAPPMDNATVPGLTARPWSTPDTTALAFEDEETGDGRVFRPGSLYWSGPGPWPLQYADEMLMGHQGAELAGAIQSVDRDGDRITGSGVLYPSRPAGADALMLLEEDAPLGVSVDLDDVSVEFVNRTVGSDEDGEDVVLLAASLPSASMLRLNDGSWVVTATVTNEWTASGATLSRTAAGTQLFTAPGGRVSAAAVHAALAPTGTLIAAAGDRDTDTGAVVHSESSGDLLMRITRARLRGATLVAMPAYDKARIVLDEEPGSSDAATSVTAAGPSDAHWRVVTYVKSSPMPVGAREVARGVGMKMETARGHLARAAKAGRIVRLARGLYVGPIREGTDLSAASSGDLDLPLDDREAIRGRVETLYRRLADAYDDPSIMPLRTDEDSGDDEETAAAGARELEASAWTAMREADPMPAHWFREPTEDELPPGSGGVHYANGRIYGWVAQAGEPHAGYPGKNLTIESLGEIDTTHFLRARFRLDDGTTVKAGAVTMNAPHHRDGAECESAACQWDDTRTVAGIVTVGMNSGGMWFAGAAAPWLSEWDRNVFAACQPSYHMKRGPNGRWQLRAVLSVPVPGHSSPLLATAVAERSNLALAASAAGLLTGPDTAGQLRKTIGRDAARQGGQRPDTAQDRSGYVSPVSSDVDATVSSLLTSPEFLDLLLTALDRRQEQRDAAALEEAQRLAASVIAPAREEIAVGHTTRSEGAT